MNMNFKKTRLSTFFTACTIAVAAGAMSPTSVAEMHSDSGHSKSEGGHNAGSSMQGGGHGGDSLKGMRQGRKDIADLLAEEDEGEDSDRPAWAGQPGNEGKPGGGNAGGDTKKGGDYGDIIVLQRNDDGTLVIEERDGDIITFAVAPDGTLIEVVNGEIPEGADVQAVEFGRLNVARSPEKVIEHSLLEALSKLDGGELGTTVTLDPSGRLVVDGATIDSPLENLALYEALLTAVAVDGVVTLSITATADGGTSTYSFSIPESVRLDLAAAALAAASDKTGELTIDEVVGISSFLGVDDELATYVGDLTYSRDDTYEGVQVIILEPRDTDGDGVIDQYVPVTVDVLTSVTFGEVDATSILNNTDGGIDIFTQMADDAVQILEFVHDNALE